MPKFRVRQRYVATEIREIEADDEDDALNKMEDDANAGVLLELDVQDLEVSFEAELVTSDH